jgi:hypothetical protein
MSDRASLTSEPAPGLGADAVRYVLQCEHDVVAGLLVPEGAPVDEVLVIRALLVRHYAATRCTCTSALRKQYGLLGEWP